MVYRTRCSSAARAASERETDLGSPLANIDRDPFAETGQFLTGDTQNFRRADSSTDPRPGYTDDQLSGDDVTAYPPCHHDDVPLDRASDVGIAVDEHAIGNDRPVDPPPDPHGPRRQVAE
jgi:hypothetical protein